MQFGSWISNNRKQVLNITINFTIKMLRRTLEALYESFGFSLLLAFLFMFLVLAVREKGFRRCMKEWKDTFLKDKEFRVIFIWAFYAAMVMCRTFLNRNMWLNPTEKIRGIWSFYDAEGHLYTENIENLVLFVPLSYLALLLMSVKKKIRIKHTAKTWVSIIASSFAASFCIEFIQLLFRCGTFQLSDLVFNTVGGTIGAILFCLRNVCIEKRSGSQD